MTPIADLLRTARLDAGLTLKQVVTHINAYAGTAYRADRISEIENGHRQPSSAMLAALATLYGINPGELCAIGNRVHPLIAERLADPDFQARAYQLAIITIHNDAS